VGAAWRGVRDLFRRAGIDTAELDARIFAEVAFGMDRLTLVNRERDLAAPDHLKALEKLAQRRLRGEPVARIIGERGFWGLAFRLNDATLVPRPETEMLVQRGLEIVGPLDHPKILDLGTGSGCIPIALLTEFSDLSAIAVDLSSEALDMARFNASRHSVIERFETRQGSWFDPVKPDERFDLIVSNPPYIESAAIETLMVEVRDHDPRLALDGGPDGLRPYRAIARDAAAHLTPDGVLLLEIGTGQGKDVTGILAASGFNRIEVGHDLGGHERMVVARIEPAS
jgi:release factor glutamine methyltransferase